MPADVRRRWDAARGVVEVRRPSNKGNGMTYDADLNLIVCEHATSSLVRERPGGRREVLASHSTTRNSTARTMSACIRAARSIFQTPGTAACRSMASSGRASSASRASIALPPAGAHRNWWSNRIFSSSRTASASRRTKKRLYVNDTVQALIRVFDVAPDGSLANARVFASGIRSELEPGLPYA